MRGDERWRVWMIVCAVLLSGPLSAAAQPTAAPKWEVEFHGGGMLPGNPMGGTVSLPEPGQVFTTATATPMPAPTSRRESSWYFGDGAILFNQADTSLTQLPGQIITLDPVLGRPLGERRRGGSFGVRVSRALTPRLSAELSVDYGLGGLRITDDNRDAIEATRASFIPAFRRVITFNPNRVLNSVTSTAALDDGSGGQLFTSAAVVIHLRTSGPIVPYVAAGAGLMSLTGEPARANLRGNYQFQLPNGAPVNETDNVTVREARGRHVVAGIVGGGLKYHVSERWGLRFDARIIISESTAETMLDATPNVVLGVAPAGRGVLGANPSIQFSNNSTDPVTALGVTAVAASSLTAPPLTGHRTFVGNGAAVHANLTVGMFWRF